ncbi:unnamed protein product, partial [Polarella glacialis]
ASNKMQREAAPFLVPEASSEPKAWLGDVADSGAPAAAGSALAWMSATADQSSPKVVPALLPSGHRDYVFVLGLPK